MADSDIQEQIDIFMEKLEKSKVPKKPSGEAIVSGKKGKVKPPKKESLIPTFKDMGITGFQIIDKNSAAYGHQVKLTELVDEYICPAYASEMSPSLKLMALVFADTKWAAKFKAVKNMDIDMPLFQACIKLGLKLDEWGQSKDWEKVKKHLPDIESLEIADLVAVAAVPLKEDQEVITKAIADGEEWVPKSQLEIPGGEEWVHDSMVIVAECFLQAVKVECLKGVSSFPVLRLEVEGNVVFETNIIELNKKTPFSAALATPIVLTGKTLTISYKSKTPITVKHTIYLSTIEQPEEPEELTDYAKEINKGCPQFLKELVEVASILSETHSNDGKPTPTQPISLYKLKGEWKAAIMPLQKEELLQLPPGPEEEKPGVLVLTQPAKIRSPGGSEMATPPTFIPIPAGLVSIKHFIWTIPGEVSADTECQVLVGYGAEGYLMKGTFKSASEAPPFKLDKGGVLKVSLLTTQPMEAWLELELEIQPPAFIMKLGEMFSPSPQPIPQLAPAQTAGPKEPETPDDKLNAAILEVTGAQESLLGNLEKLETMMQEMLGKEFPNSVKEEIQEQKQKIQALNKEATGSIGIMDQAEHNLQQPSKKFKLVETGKSYADEKKPTVEGMTKEEAAIEMQNLVSKGTGKPSLEAVKKAMASVTKKEKPKGYKPKITAVNVNGKAVDAKELAEAFRSHLKKADFTHYMIEGSDHEFKKTKGVLMNKKITWAGDPEANLVKWALTNKEGKTITVHYKVGITLPLLVCLGQLALGIKQGGGI